MKKLLIFSLLLVGCQKQNIEPKDCNCDRIITFTMPSYIGQQTQIAGKITTINDCSQAQTIYSYTAKGNELPVVGKCRTTSMY